MVMHGDQDPSELYVHDDLTPRPVYRVNWIQVEPGKAFNTRTKETAVLDPATGLWRLEQKDVLKEALKTFFEEWDRHADWESRHRAVEELRKQSR